MLFEITCPSPMCLHCCVGQDLMAYTQEELVALWEEVAGHSIHRQASIMELDTMLTTIEDERVSLVRPMFGLANCAAPGKLFK